MLRSHGLSDFMQGWMANESAALDFTMVKHVYIDLCEGNLYDALLFSRMMYWSGNSHETGKPRMSIEHEGHLWVARSYDEWDEECRIKPDTARKAINRLCKLGLVVKMSKKFSGNKKLHLRVDFVALERGLKRLMKLDDEPEDEPEDDQCDTAGQTEVVYKGICPDRSHANGTTGQMDVTYEDTPINIEYDIDYKHRGGGDAGASAYAREIPGQNPEPQTVVYDDPVWGWVEVVVGGDDLPERPLVEPEPQSQRGGKGHPGVSAFIEVTQRWPGHALVDLIAERLGERPNRAALEKAWLGWIGRGFNSRNVKGVLDWYDNFCGDANWDPDGGRFARRGGRVGSSELASKTAVQPVTTAAQAAVLAGI